jgi:hypothetical protein
MYVDLNFVFLCVLCGESYCIPFALLAACSRLSAKVIMQFCGGGIAGAFRRICAISAD